MWPIHCRSSFAQLEFMGQSLRPKSGFLVFTRHIAAEIEVMNPAVDRDGQRPDNCEYPWEDGAQALHSPLDWAFSPLHLLRPFRLDLCEGVAPSNQSVRWKNCNNIPPGVQDTRISADTN